MASAAASSSATPHLEPASAVQMVPAGPLFAVPNWPGEAITFWLTPETRSLCLQPLVRQRPTSISPVLRPDLPDRAQVGDELIVPKLKSVRIIHKLALYTFEQYPSIALMHTAESLVSLLEQLAEPRVGGGSYFQGVHVENYAGLQLCLEARPSVAPMPLPGGQAPLHIGSGGDVGVDEAIAHATVVAYEQGCAFVSAHLRASGSVFAYTGDGRAALQIEAGRPQYLAVGGVLRVAQSKYVLQARIVNVLPRLLHEGPQEMDVHAPESSAPGGDGAGRTPKRCAGSPPAGHRAKGPRSSPKTTRA